MPEHSKTSSNSNWNYHPDLPLADNSIFKWPPDPSFAANWLRTNWLSLSERVLMLLLAILLWIWVYPDLEAAKEFCSWLDSPGLDNQPCPGRQYCRRPASLVHQVQ